VSRFDKKELNPLLRVLVSRIDAALEIPDVARRGDALRATDREAKDALYDLEDKENRGAALAFGWAALGMLAVAAVSIALPAALGIGIAYFGLAGVCLGAAKSLQHISNSLSVEQAKFCLGDKVQREIDPPAPLPQEPATGFAKALSRIFNGSSGEKRYERLRQRIHAPQKPVPV
jgi:hypothetical protein